MSATLSATAARVRRRIRDEDPANYAVFSDLMAELIAGKLLRVGIAIGYRPSWQTGVATLTVGSQADVSLAWANSAQGERVIALKLAALGSTPGYLLDPAPWEEIEAVRQNWTSDTGRSDPVRYHLFEDSAQASKVRLDAIPTRAYTVDALVGLMPVRAYTDATTLPFSENALVALELMCASDGLRLMRASDLQKRELNPALAEMWYVEGPDGRIGGEAGALLRGEKMRLSRLQQSHVHRHALSF